MDELAQIQSENEIYNKYLSLGAFTLTSSPAYKTLTSLPSSETQSNLTTALQQLYAHLLQRIGDERNLLRHAKQISTTIHKQNVDIDKNQSRTFIETTSIGELKAELMKAANEAALCTQRENQFNRDAELLTNKKMETTEAIEQARRHQIELLEPQLQARIKELKLEVLQKSQQIENLKKDIHEHQDQQEGIHKDKERVNQDLLKFQAANEKAADLPARLSKQIEVLKEASAALTAESAREIELVKQLELECNNEQKTKRELEEAKQGITTECERSRLELQEMDRHCNEISREHDLAREQIMIQKEDRIRMEAQFKMKRDHDAHIRLLREKDFCFREVHRLENLVDNIKSTIPVWQSQVDDKRRQLNVSKQEDVAIVKAAAEMRKEIDISLSQYLQREVIVGVHLDEFKMIRAHNAKYEAELLKLNEEREEMAAMFDNLGAQKDVKSRELVREQARHRAVVDEELAIGFQMTEARKSHEAVTEKLQEIERNYETVKNERNRCVTLISIISQKSAEIKDKLKISANEMDILKNEIIAKEKELTKQKQDLSNAETAREIVRNDTNHLMRNYKDNKERVTRKKAEMESFEHTVMRIRSSIQFITNQTATAKIDLAKMQNVVDERNGELRELSIRSQETSRQQDASSQLLAESAEEIRQLELECRSLQREIPLLRKQRGIGNEKYEQLQILKANLQQTTMQVKELSEKIENPLSSDRVMNLPGSEPSEQQLAQQFGDLARRLEEKEHALVEKHLILEEVVTLTQRLEKQTKNDRKQGATLSAKLNELSRKLKAATRAMMAKSSELEMQSKSASALYAQRQLLAETVEKAKENIANGQVPVAEWESEFNKSEHYQQIRAAESRRANASAVGEFGEQVLSPSPGKSQRFFMVNGLKTTALPRANAYIPSSDPPSDQQEVNVRPFELALPKVYSSLAPFKPSELGTNFKKLKKPNVIPLEPQIQ